MRNPSGLVRFVGTAWWLQLKQMSANRLYVSTAIVQPVIIAAVAFLAFRHSTEPNALESAALGSGILGMWTSTLLASGAAVARMRFMGLLEGLIASPTPLSMVVFPITFAAATLGIYSLLATLTLGWLFFDVAPVVANPIAAAFAIPALIVSVGGLGMLLAALFVLYPNAIALSNMAAYPIALLCGVLVPVSELPGPFRTLSAALPPTWGVRAVHEAMLGTGAAVAPTVLCVAATAVYVTGAAILFRVLVHRARTTAKLALA